MSEIIKIDVKKPLKVERKKVAAYARVSMETDRLEHSLSAQISYYSKVIQKNPDWIYAGVYSDNGISGTGTAKRHGFQEMIEAADAGKIDIILTKSISRFARNTVDLLNTVRHLKDIGVEVRFEKENIRSLSSDGELMLTVLASFAQEESRSISENVKWGLRKRIEEGRPTFRPKILGYRWEGNQLVVVPDEAKIVKRIYQNFLDGKSRLATERELAAENFRSVNGKTFHDSQIKAILTNITYTGNLLFQKKYIEDPISKKRRQNNGELPQYFLPDTHEAIIPMETFRYVQDEMARRAALGQRGCPSRKLYCFSGKIKCPYCGVSYMHFGGKHNYWKCGVTKKRGGHCPVSGSIIDNKLREACARAMGLAEFDEDEFTEQVDHIEVPATYTIRIFMKDGREIEEKCIPTGHQDFWTPERRAAASARNRKHPKKCPRSFFTSKIKCLHCGKNYCGRVKTYAGGRKMRLWSCQSRACTGVSLREDKLQESLAKAAGIERFDKKIFEDKLDHIEVDGKMLTYIFSDGSSVQQEWKYPKGARRQQGATFNDQ